MTEDVENNNIVSATNFSDDVTESTPATAMTSAPNGAGGQKTSSATISDVQPRSKSVQSAVSASLESRNASQPVRGPESKLSQADKLDNNEALAVDPSDDKQGPSADKPLSEREKPAPKKLSTSQEQCPAKASNDETKSSSCASFSPDPSREQEHELCISSSRVEETSINDHRQYKKVRFLMIFFVLFLKRASMN